MPTQIELVKELSADSNNWYEKYPWYSLGQLVNVSNKRQQDGFQSVAKTAAIFFNDIQRMHWLLHEQAINKNKILSELNVPISTEGMQHTPQPFTKREHILPVTAPDHLIAVAAVEENDAIALLPSPVSNINIGDEEIIIHHEAKKVEEDSIANIESTDNVEITKVEEEGEPAKNYIQQLELVNEVTEIIEPESAYKPIVIEEDKALIEDSNEAIANGMEAKIEGENLATEDDLKNITKAQENIKAALGGGEPMDLTFEPYHTVDYFASQGIKVDSKMDDRLGKQLKSFTSWLKTMKRLPANIDTTADTHIVPINDKSLENTNVVTEAMAAVFVKQGKNEQAIEIFKKLSLLHPEKSRYFVAQIEQIKN